MKPVVATASSNFTITYDQAAGGWEQVKVRRFREGEALVSKEHHAAFFSAKVLPIWYGVAACEAIAQQWRTGSSSTH